MRPLRPTEKGLDGTLLARDGPGKGYHRGWSFGGKAPGAGLRDVKHGPETGNPTQLPSGVVRERFNTKWILVCSRERAKPAEEEG